MTGFDLILQRIKFARRKSWEPGRYIQSVIEYLDYEELKADDWEEVVDGICICEKIKEMTPKSSYDAVEVDIGDPGHYTSLRMGYKDETHYLTAIGEDEAYVGIDFCPFCGRKLSKD